jgi:hypothetical protein
LLVVGLDGFQMGQVGAIQTTYISREVNQPKVVAHPRMGGMAEFAGTMEMTKEGMVDSVAVAAVAQIIWVPVVVADIPVAVVEIAMLTMAAEVEEAPLIPVPTKSI